jgi:hypothetical protein
LTALWDDPSKISPTIAFFKTFPMVYLNLIEIEWFVRKKFMGCDGAGVNASDFHFNVPFQISVWPKKLSKCFLILRGF